MIREHVFALVRNALATSELIDPPAAYTRNVLWDGPVTFVKADSTPGLCLEEIKTLGKSSVCNHSTSRKEQHDAASSSFTLALWITVAVLQNTQPSSRSNDSAS